MTAKLSITTAAVAADANNTSNLPEKVERRRERERGKEEETRVKQRKETLSSLKSFPLTAIPPRMLRSFIGGVQTHCWLNLRMWNRGVQRADCIFLLNLLHSLNWARLDRRWALLGRSISGWTGCTQIRQYPKERCPSSQGYREC